MINCYLEELKRNFNNVYSSTDNVLIEHIEYLLIFLKDCKKTNFIITQLKNDEYYTEWEPIESKHAIGYEDFNLPKNKKSVAALSLYLLEEFVNDNFIFRCRHQHNIKGEEYGIIIKKLFVKKLEDYIYLNIKCSNDILYLLDKYKHQCEWFTKEQLISIYNKDTKHGEYNLTKDLRKFLFDNGIDYPFSEPNSPSGNVDLIYGLETENPLTLEIKLFGNNYGKNHIRKGFRQAIKYAKDYNQEYAYLFIYNLEDKILEIENDHLMNNIISINHANKIIYIIIANLKSSEESASKLKNMKIEKISKKYLINDK